MPARSKPFVKAGAIALAALIAATTQAMAGGFAIREQSAEFQGSSFAGAAAGGLGLSSMFWNPATITMHKGMKSESNATLIMPWSKADNQVSPRIPPLLGNSGNIGQNAIVPASYNTFQLGDMIWLGLGVTAPFGMKTENNPLSAGALYGYKSDIFNINVNPVVALKLNDMISLATGVQISYMEGDLSTAAGGVIQSRVKGDDWGYGFTAGLLLTPMEGTRVGIGYRSRVKHHLKGSLYLAALGATNPASVKTTLPDMVTFSVHQQVTDRFALKGTVEWANWSVLKEFDVQSAPVDPAPEAYDWKDSWHLAIGGEYAMTDQFTLRAGYAFEKSPVPDSTRGVRVPDNDRHWLSAGFSFAANEWLTVHGSYTHVFMKDGDFSLSDPSRRPVSGSFEQQINIFAVSATIDTGKLFFGR